jgi:sulfatase maturation enzyme AslB (radical SAM superfamily)
MDTFCVLPWFSKEIDWDLRETPCCLLPPGHNLEEIKKDLLNGRQTPACQKCWNLENQGLKSDRQLKNKTLDFYWDRDIDNIKQDATLGDTPVRILKLTTSYTCNATCVSCSAGFSSSWAQLNRQTTASIPSQSYKFIDLDKIKQRIDFKELKMLSLLGGEPLYEKKNFELLEHLLDLGNDQIFLSIITNGSVRLSDYQKKVLARFKRLNFSVSIDGTESIFEYLRFPLRWDDLNKNLIFFKEISNNVSSNYTLSNLNILYHNQTKSWFDQNHMVFSVNPIYFPTWLQPRALSADIKKVLKEKLDFIDYNTFIGSMHTDTDQQNFESMLKNIQLQDSLKKISINDYLPDLVKMF